jgi:hypothetical protein
MLALFFVCDARSSRSDGGLALQKRLTTLVMKPLGELWP